MAKLDRRRSFLRQSGFRDARLIGIACEGSLTELRYFEAVKEKLAEHPSRIHIELIKREEASKSAPKHVINSLDAFRKKVGFLLSDNFWAVIDYDRWGEKALRDAAKKLNKKDICSQLVGHALKSGFCFICFQKMILTFHV